MSALTPGPGLFFLAGLLLLIAASFTLSRLPRGVPYAQFATYEGLLDVPASGLGEAVYESADDLRAQARVRRGPGQSRLLCINGAAEVREQLARMRSSLAPGQAGGGSLWVRVVAQKRWGKFPCNRHLAPQYRKFGTLLWITRIDAMHPLGCDRRDFIARSLRCPAQPLLTQRGT